MVHPLAQLLSQAGGGAIVNGNEHWPATYWLVPLAPVGFYMIVSLMLNVAGSSDHKNPIKFFFDSISNSLERLSGVEGWAMAGILTGLLFLLEAAMGLYWDVAWHVDFGRDVGTLFTPPHVTILIGLGGLIFASVIAISFASMQEADTKLRFGANGQIRVPYGGLLLGILGIGAIAAFPLDALWHQAYGIDVTLWSPTHLQLVTGGSFGTFAVMLLFAEAMPKSRPNPFGRFWLIVASGAVLTAVSTYMGEFDYRVPQFQPVYLPILIMGAAGVALVFARIAIGRWGAVKAAVAFLVIRTYLSVLVTSLHHTWAHFPLYLPSALAVEAAAYWVGTRNRAKFGLVAGVLIGTLGLVGETIWIQASNWFAPSPQLLVKTLELAPLAAVAGAVLGAGLGRAFKQGSGKMPLALLGGAAAVLIACLAIPLPRSVGNVNADIKMTPIGDGSSVNVTVAVSPPDAAKNAVFFGVGAWQGGGTRRIVLKETGTPGLYSESTPIPVTGKWKSLVILVKGNWDMAAPIYMPRDVVIHAPEIPVVPERNIAFARNTTYLLREAHGGPAAPRELGYMGLAVTLMIFVGLIAYASQQMETDESQDLEYPGSGGSFSSLWTPAPKSPVPAGSYRPGPGSNGNGHSNGNGSGGSWHPPTGAGTPGRWQPGGLTGARY